MVDIGTLRLKPGRDKSVRRRHPWIFSGSVASVTGVRGVPGEPVAVIDAAGEMLGVASYNPASQIVGRMWSFGEEASVSGEFVRGRITAAAERRDSLLQSGRTDAVRLVFAESDGVPGLIADRYGDWVVVEITAAAAEFWQDDIVAALADLPGVRGVYERSDLDARRREGLPERTGTLAGDAPPTEVEITEDGARYLVDVRAGHKTGFYLDQRESRATAGRVVQPGDHVLNVFAYTGAFGVVAGGAGAARVVNVDSSAPALAMAERHAVLNGVETVSEYTEADAFSELRRLRRATDERFDVIVLDPPKLAPSSNPKALDRATRAYKDLSLQAFHLLRPGGRLLTFSCSGAMSEDLFQKVVAGAALDAGVDARVVGRLHQAEDHPVALAVPETAYLKGLLCTV